MPEPVARQNFQRARRAAEKAERRETILVAAADLLRSTGFEGFSMAILAARAGIAKGTLYLYFETREEVLLALYVEALAAFSRALTAGLRDGMSDREFVALFRDGTAADANFTVLSARLESVIEHNVSLEKLVAAKRAMRALVEGVAPRVESVLGLGAGSGAPLLLALGALHLGAEQSNTGPALADLDFPDDVAAFMHVHNQLDLFRDFAPMLVAGTRGAAR